MLSRFTGLLIVVALSMVMQGCASTGAQGFAQGDEDAQRAITSTWQRDVNAKNWKGVAAAYTKDAVLMPPNGPNVQGRENIEQFFANFPPVSDMKLALVEIERRDDIAFVRGVYSMNITLPDGSTVRDSGKYVELRKKQADGTWQISHDMFNSDLPASH
jgi:uncharacterized protein (TIGR02246 family)